ncbi:MAG TPA: alpha/beta fold hydrolase, partial [Phycisphaerae bacterium]|nr:alpha/beta fold hydrolase [Phycisphaerae bacterium]
GYSRDGKAMTIGAALDQRIAAVIAGSPGVGGILPFRLAGERNMAESIQSTTLMFPDWFHPRLRYFAGREDRLPVDGNLLLATIAPRPFFLVAGINDEVSNDWGDEQSFHSAQKVYDLLGAKDKLGILRVPGNHGANDWEQAMTWLDIQFGKSDKKWTNNWMFAWDYQQWEKNDPVNLSRFTDRRGLDLLANMGGGPITASGWETTKVPEIRRNIEWLLGDPAVSPTAPALPPRPAVQDVPAWVIRRSLGGLPEFGWYAADNAKAATRPVEFNGVKGTLYYPKDTPPGTKLPVAIWLHSYSYPLGYMWVYHRELHPILGLVDNGYAVLAYDQTGFGSRMIEASEPYLSQTPKWSQMGHMVADARAAVDVLSKDPALDAKKIYLFGYSVGGSVALYTAAMEPRVAGVVSICGFTPMRTDTADKGTGGLARFAIDRPLIPRLGAFIGNEGEIPVDYNEIIAAIAPRPVYIMNPLYDRDATTPEVHAAAEAARKIYALYKAEDNLKLDEPYDYNELAGTTQDRILIWMSHNMK